MLDTFNIEKAGRYRHGLRKGIKMQFVEDFTEFKFQVAERRKSGVSPAIATGPEDRESCFQFELKFSGNAQRILEELERVSATIRRAVREP
jgi:hypothetical protein